LRFPSFQKSLKLGESLNLNGRKLNLPLGIGRRKEALTFQNNWKNNWKRK